MSQERFEAIITESIGGPVSVGVMFGGRGLRTGKRFFAVWWGDRLIVKLPPQAIETLEAAGHGTEYLAKGNRPMKDWAQLEDSADWSLVCDQARAYVEST